MYFFESQPDQTHYFGYVYFRQVKDADIKRGYFQKVTIYGCACIGWAYTGFVFL